MAVETDELVRPASVQYGDFKGTAAADTHGGGSSELIDLIGLDRDRFWVVGIDFWGADLETGRLEVFAIDRDTTGIADHAALVAYEAQHGEVPVTNFLVHGMSIAQILKVGLKRLHVQLLSRSLPEGTQLRVTVRDDLNYDGD
ncbi:hypothetical protein [Microbacterium stercoris]|uniref:Uncharacterized protein n=1 Tax=Microbacterium stercoris TaxID=2820289 RepID=A0A939TME6_9MICO|nr:hypothetical protein [Microbacterium stercoris]MBO3663118.1 hypothetical protein [Microbacterium stercoris]